MSEQNLWLRFPNGKAIEPFPVPFDESAKKRFTTFDAFRENYIRGWGGTDEKPEGDLTEYVVQEARPGADAVWQRAPEFAEVA